MAAGEKSPLKKYEDILRRREKKLRKKVKPKKFKKNEKKT